MSLFAASLLLLSGAPEPRTAFDFWMVSTGEGFDNEIIVLVDRSKVLTRPDGWTTFATVTVLNGSRHTAYKSDSEFAWVNCKTREHVREYGLYYGDDGKLVYQKKWTEPRRVVTPGSMTEDVVAFVCGDQRGAVQLPKGADPRAAADELYARNHRAVAKAPAPQRPSAAPAPRAAIDYWLVYAGEDIGFERIIVIDKSTAQRSPDGWMKFSYVEVFNGSRIKLSMKSMRTDARANCKTREFVDDLTMAYNADGKLEVTVGASEPSRVDPPDSINGMMLAFVCGDAHGAVPLPKDADPVDFADEIYLSGRETTAKAPPPNRATEFWLVLADGTTGEFTLFADRASIAKRADGKTSVAMETITRKPGNFFWFRFQNVFDCARRRYRDVEAKAYREDGTLIEPIDSQSEESVKAGSPMEVVYNFVCKGSRKNMRKLPPGQTTLEASANVQRNPSAGSPPTPAP